MALTPTYRSYEECDLDGPFTEGKFHSGESMKEGVSGKAALDTTYENLKDTEVVSPRSGYNDELKEDDDLKKGCSTLKKR
jgi:hypothetical protein